MPVSGGTIELSRFAERSRHMESWISIFHRATLISRRVPTLLRYAITLALTLAVTWACLDWEFGRQYIFLFYILVVLVCSALLDRGNGFAATAFAAVLGSYYFLHPLYAFEVKTGEDHLGLAAFVLIGIAVASVVEALHAGLAELTDEHERVRAAVRDRELLLDELAHRTRNDFANVVTLLNLQSRTASEETKSALQTAAERVQTVARVHRRLDLRDSRVVVDTKDYIGELCADLRLSRLAMRPIAIELQVESHAVSIEKAIPIGLIINESVTNAAKHAFPGDGHGVIVVSFVRSDHIYTLSIVDNGVGTDLTNGNGNGTGSRLMQLLAAQLGSSVRVEQRNPGTAIIVAIGVKSEARAR
jgi:two-component sensor histidine kinase